MKHKYSGFEKEVLESKGTVLVDFWANWCEPCKLTSPILDELRNELKEVKFVKVDINEESDVLDDYNVTSIPTLMLFKDGELKERLVGFRKKDDLRSTIEKYID
ncbi:thioredoxin [Clostridium mediterraneense]|uniref:thioredoxin n=1 Tax=Clostridium mediterraneense TaxID=1805472 RepID=UPI000829CAEC|nr:thioredoxin [Clostridium mediterraneense]